MMAQKKMSGVTQQLSTMALPQPDSNGMWRGKLELTGHQHDDDFEATAELIGYFARLVSSGAMASSSYVGRSSVSKCHVLQRNGALVAEVEALHVHSGAWRVLLQMLAHAHAMESYESVALSPTSGYSRADIREPLALEQAYPPPLDPSSVTIQRGDVRSWREGFCASLEFGRDLLSAEVAGISGLVDDWGGLIYVGGFTSVMKTVDEPLINKPETYRVGDDRVEVTVSSCDCDEEAIAPLLNALVLLDPVLALKALTLELSARSS